MRGQWEQRGDRVLKVPLLGWSGVFEEVAGVRLERLAGTGFWRRGWRVRLRSTASPSGGRGFLASERHLVKACRVT